MGEQQKSCFEFDADAETIKVRDASSANGEGKDDVCAVATGGSAHAEAPAGDGGVADAPHKGEDWHVVQVRSGQERRMCELIRAACDEHDRVSKPDDAVGLKECFSPRFRAQKKWKHGWRDVEYPLIPGYVIAVTGEPARLAGALRSVDDLCRLVSAGETYVPLDEGERAWIESQTHKGDRAVPMSFGHREGDKLVVTDGPLKGQEGKIVRIDRRNGLAHLELHAGPLTIKTSVGLVVVPGN